MANNGAPLPLPNPYALIMHPGGNIFAHLGRLQRAFSLHRNRDPNSEYHNAETRAHCLLVTLPLEYPWTMLRNRFHGFIFTRAPGIHAWRFNFLGPWNVVLVDVYMTFWADALDLVPPEIPDYFHDILGLPPPPGVGQVPPDVPPPGDHIELVIGEVDMEIEEHGEPEPLFEAEDEPVTPEHDHAEAEHPMPPEEHGHAEAEDKELPQPESEVVDLITDDEKEAREVQDPARPIAPKKRKWQDAVGPSRVKGPKPRRSRRLIKKEVESEPESEQEQEEEEDPSEDSDSEA